MATALELLYEGTQTSAIRPTIINAILESEHYENWSRIAELTPSLNTAETQYLVNEGFWDRMKAKGAGAVGALRGAGQQVKGGFQNAVGNIANGAGNLAAKGVQSVGGTIDPANNKLSQWGQQKQQQGQSNIQQGQQSGMNAKIKSYVNSAADTVVNDMSKLGLPVQDPAALRQAIVSSLLGSLASIPSYDAPVQQPQQTAPPVQQAPQQAPQQRQRRARPPRTADTRTA